MIPETRNASIKPTKVITIFLRYIVNRFFFPILVLISLFILLFSNNQFFLSNSIQNLFSITIKPTEHIFYHLGKYGENFLNLFEAYNQNLLLKEEIEKLNFMIQDIEIIKAENIRLKELLYFVPTEEFIYKTARIISISSGPHSKTGIISAGSKDNIDQNKIIIGKYGVIGRVLEVYKNTSKILFITDFNSRIPVVTANSMEKGIAVGNNSNFLDLLYSNENSKICLNELVLTSGDGQFYPAGLVVGRIKEINGSKIKIEPFLKLERLEYISILLQKVK